MTIYISGPMTGIENYNYPLFNLVAKNLRDKGYTVINPTEIEPTERTWKGFMRADIKALMDANSILMLPGWENSKGAVIEKYLGEALGMDVYCRHYSDFLGLPDS